MAGLLQMTLMAQPDIPEICLRSCVIHAYIVVIGSWMQLSVYVIEYFNDQS